MASLCRNSLCTICTPYWVLLDTLDESDLPDWVLASLNREPLERDDPNPGN